MRFHHTQPTGPTRRLKPSEIHRRSQELFEQLDTDKSGAISLEELTVGLRQQGYVLTDNEIELLMKKVRGSCPVLRPICLRPIPSLPPPPLPFIPAPPLSPLPSLSSPPLLSLTLLCSPVNIFLRPPLRHQVDADHDGTMDLTEFITTLIDWNKMQETQGWQVKS
jgi:hypothetical protein